MKIINKEFKSSSLERESQLAPDVVSFQFKYRATDGDRCFSWGSEVKVRCDDDEVRLFVCKGVSTSQKWEETNSLSVFSEIKTTRDDETIWSVTHGTCRSEQQLLPQTLSSWYVLFRYLYLPACCFTSVFSSHSCFEHRNTSSIRVNKPPNMHRDWDKLHNSPSWRPKAIVPTVSDLSRMPSVTLIFRSVYSVCSVHCLHWSMTVRGSGVQSDGWHQISVVLDQIKSASRSDVNWKHPIDFNLVWGRARHSWRSSFIFSIDVYDGCST